MNIERSVEPKVRGARGENLCKRTRAFAVRTIKLCRTIERHGASTVVVSQMVKSATPVGANVQEAQAAQSVADFVSKMQTALKEAREARYWYRVALESQVLVDPYANYALDEIDQLFRILFVIVQRAKKRSKT